MDKKEYDNRILEAKKPFLLLWGIIGLPIGLALMAFGIMLGVFTLYYIFT